MARSPANLLTAAALLGLPTAGFALGLGDIQLKSALNQPLDAQIEILGATPQDLRDLHAAIAGRETFNRYGLDYPQLLGSFRFSVEKSASGADVLRVTSPQAVTEPFLTFLVEADWTRGRLLREYTVLLDPPVFMPEQTAPVAVEAPRGATAQPAPGAGQIERPAEPVAPVRAERPAEPVRETAAPSEPSVTDGQYQVRRGDTLWVIANQTRPDSSISVNQMMVALYRNNPDAFLGNMNLVKEGSVLRVPSSNDITALSSGEANAEVGRQAAEWRGGAVAHASAEAQLKLVPPKAGAETSESASQAPAATNAANAASPDAVARAEQRSAALSAENADLKGQLDEARRLLAVKNAELAKMQQSLTAAAGTQAEVPAPVESEGGESGVDLESGQAAPAAAAGSAESTATTPSEPVAEEPATEQPTSTTPAVAPAPTAAAPVVQAPEAQKSWLDAMLGKTWLWVAAGLALLLAAAGLAIKRRRPALAPLEALEDETATTGAHERIEPELERTIVEAPAIAAAAKPTRTTPAKAPAAAAGTTSDTGTFEVTGTFRPVDFDTVQSAGSEPYPFEDSGSALAIDQADPISEADFHMAYGLYDQASELIKKALDREPGRQDLQLKLLEILFMWSNKDAFREQAQKFRADLTRGGHWDKIVIMGKQICPGDAMFDATPDVSGGGVDLDLATVRMPAGGQAPNADDSPSLDLDLDDALTAKADLHAAETVPATGEYLEITRKEEAGEVEVHDEQLTAVARRLEARMRPRAGDVGVALDLGETIAPEDVSATRTLTENKSPKKSEDDAFGDFFAFTGVAEAPEPDPTGTREVVLDFEGDMLPDSTTAEFKIELPEDGSAIDLDIGATGANPRLADGTTAMLAPSGDTTVVSSFGDTATIREPGFVDPTARTVQAPRLGGLGGSVGSDDVTVSGDMLDFNIGSGDTADGERDSTLRVSPSELALPEAEDGVLDEVGTKLDLARAYLDMGDPDGARSILEEVIEEGDESQRQNAHTLLRSIA